MSNRTYNVTTKAVPHGKGEAEGKPSAGTVIVNISEGGGQSGSSHEHANKALLDALNATQDRELWLLENGAYGKIGAGHADEADEAAHAVSADEAAHASSAHVLDADSPTRSEFLSRINSDNAQGLITFDEGSHFGNFVSGMLAGIGGAVDSLGNAEFESLRVRTALEVLELLTNRLAAVEGDQLFTEADTVEAVEAINATSYRLRLRKKYEGYFTAFTAGSVVKGMFNDLSQGGGHYFTSWMRVDSVNQAANSIVVTLYPDEQVPSGHNYAPCEMMRIVRWGHQTDASKQSPIEISSTERRMSIFSGVDKPKLDAIANYGMTLGKLPEWLAAELTRLGYQIDNTQDYVYAKGIITEDLLQYDRQGRLPHDIVDMGLWEQGADCKARRREGNREVTTDYWHYGCRWRCMVDATTAEPRWDSTDWAMVEGNSQFRIEFLETDRIFDPDDFSCPLTLRAWLGNCDVTADIASADVMWTRRSVDHNGNERIASDAVWASSFAASGRDPKAVVLDWADLSVGSSPMPKSIEFTATATLHDGVVATATIAL